MLSIQREFNTVHRRFLHNVVQTTGAAKLVKHLVNVDAKKLNGEIVSIQLYIKAEVLDYGPTIFYEILTDIPYKKGEWLEHPFNGLRLENPYQVGDHIHDTPAIRKIIEDLVLEDNWKKYIYSAGVYQTENVKGTLHNCVVDLVGDKTDDATADSINVKLKLKVHALLLDNNQIALKISTNVPIKDGEWWDMHPFRRIHDNKEKTTYTGILNDTPAVRQMLNDLVTPNEWKLYVTYDISYREGLIENLYKLFLKPREKTKCKVINDLMNCLSVHWS